MGEARDVGRDADQDLLLAAEPGRDPFQPLEVIEVVEHDVPHARLECLSQLQLGFRVAVEVDPGRVEPPAERQEQLPAEATSQARPSSASTRQTAVHGNALEANSTS